MSLQNPEKNFEKWNNDCSREQNQFLKKRVSYVKYLKICTIPINRII